MKDSGRRGSVAGRRHPRWLVLPDPDAAVAGAGRQEREPTQMPPGRQGSPVTAYLPATCAEPGLSVHQHHRNLGSRQRRVIDRLIGRSRYVIFAGYDTRRSVRSKELPRHSAEPRLADDLRLAAVAGKAGKGPGLNLAGRQRGCAFLPEWLTRGVQGYFGVKRRFVAGRLVVAERIAEASLAVRAPRAEVLLDGRPEGGPGRRCPA